MLKLISRLFNKRGGEKNGRKCDEMCRRHETGGRIIFRHPAPGLAQVFVTFIPFGLMMWVSSTIKQENDLWLSSPSCSPSNCLEKTGGFCGSVFVLFYCVQHCPVWFCFKERFCFDILLCCNI